MKRLLKKQDPDLEDKEEIIKEMIKFGKDFINHEASTRFAHTIGPNDYVIAREMILQEDEKRMAELRRRQKSEQLDAFDTMNPKQKFKLAHKIAKASTKLEIGAYIRTPPEDTIFDPEGKLALPHKGLVPFYHQRDISQIANKGVLDSGEIYGPIKDLACGKSKYGEIVLMAMVPLHGSNQHIWVQCSAADRMLVSIVRQSRMTIRQAANEHVNARRNDPDQSLATTIRKVNEENIEQVEDDLIKEGFAPEEVKAEDMNKPQNASYTHAQPAFLVPKRNHSSIKDEPQLTALKQWTPELISIDIDPKDRPSDDRENHLTVREGFDFEWQPRVIPDHDFETLNIHDVFSNGAVKEKLITQP